jgi:hypothetical protein
MLKVWNCTQFSLIEYRKLDIYSNSNFNTITNAPRLLGEFPEGLFLFVIYGCVVNFFRNRILAVDIECTFVQNDWIDLIVSCLLVCNGNRLESF